MSETAQKTDVTLLHESSASRPRPNVRDSLSTNAMKAKRGCWTCKDRKVQCDRGLPTCKNCARVQRECNGYGLRLSWPKPNDKRRAMTAKSPPVEARVRRTDEFMFINTGWEDVEWYHHLPHKTAQPDYLVRLSPQLWRQPQSRIKHMDLVQYFHDAAHLSLVTFGPKPYMIRDILIRMALTNSEIPAVALFYALLAVSSLRRNGLQLEAMQFKVAALHALSTSAKKGALSSAEASQHIATCMLLCSFEIQLPSESSGEWLRYIWGAMDIIQEAGLESKLHLSDVGHLIDWVYYHDAVSRFTMRHWRYEAETVAVEENSSESGGIPYLALAKARPPLRSPSPAHAILNLLSEACSMLLDPEDPQTQDAEYKNRLLLLERRIRNLPSTASLCPTPTMPPDDFTIHVDVYQMATQIYVGRVIESQGGTSMSLETLIERAFAVPLQESSCDHFFPLFILACEARTDEQRTTILSIVNRTQKVSHVRSMKWFSDRIQLFWALKDLHADSDVLANYLHVLGSVISSSNTLPSYV